VQALIRTGQGRALCGNSAIAGLGATRCHARATLFGMVDDTTPEAAAIVRHAIRQQTPAERVHAAIALSESVRAISLATLQARFPERTTLQLVALITGESMVPSTRSGPRASA